MVALPTPFEAYRLDLGRLGVEDELCSADSMWLLVAHCLSRFADQPETARLDLAERCAQALEQFAATANEAVEIEGVTPLDEASLGELKRLIEGLRRYGERQGQDIVAKAVLDMSARISAVGAITLAFTLVANAQKATPNAPTQSIGMLLSEQGRITRLLGNLDEADKFYAQVHALGERTGDRMLLGRAAIGRGNTSRLRGNYPKAREFFTDALAAGEGCQHVEIQRLAHQGLTILAGEARNYDDALLHGWLTFVHSNGRKKEESEALVNLANISVLAGQPRAALHAVMSALPNVHEERMLIPTLGIATLAAARCNELSLMESLSGRLQTVVADSQLPYESAQSLLSLAQGLGELGLISRAYTARDRALEIAESRGFHELVHIAEQKEFTRQPEEAPREWTDSSREVLANLEALECAIVL
jgi:tetratricopeptide (TPR) repeat protein